MAEIVLKNGTRREFSRVSFDVDGGKVVAMEDHREVDSFPAFHVGRIVFDDGVVFVMDDPDE
jgi:hypothetical protein